MGNHNFNKKYGKSGYRSGKNYKNESNRQLRRLTKSEADLRKVYSSEQERIEIRDGITLLENGHRTNLEYILPEEDELKESVKISHHSSKRKKRNLKIKIKHLEHFIEKWKFATSKYILEKINKTTDQIKTLRKKLN